MAQNWLWDRQIADMKKKKDSNNAWLLEVGLQGLRAHRRGELDKEWFSTFDRTGSNHPDKIFKKPSPQ